MSTEQDIYFSTLINENGNVVQNTLNDDYNSIKERVTNYCIQKNNKEIVLLCCALAKYDYHGAPSNWETKYYHEETIFEWALWCQENSKKKELEKIIRIYNEGHIPDCFDLMEEYFD